MMQRKLPQDSFPARRQLQENFAPFLNPAFAPDKSTRLKPVYQLDCTVMLNLHPVRQFPNPRTYRGRQTLKRQHQLVLPRFKPSIAHDRFAEMQERSNPVPELRQRLIIFGRKLRLDLAFSHAL